MKKLVFVLSLFILLSGLSAQSLNSKGFYIDNEGGLFSGTISRVQEGIRTELSVQDGLITGPANYFFASGKLMESGMFVNGQKDQKWLRYSESGNITALAFYSLGKKSGTWVVFDEQGNKRCEMNYTDGQKSGVWISWDEQGKQVEQKDYSRVN